MKAAEIRDTDIHASGSPGQMYRPAITTEIDAAKSIFEMLREIAAQLAEANEQLAKIANPIIVNAESPWVTLEFRGIPFVINREEVTGVAPMLEGNIHPPTTVMIGIKGQPWSKSADGTVADICAKLGIPMEG